MTEVVDRLTEHRHVLQRLQGPAPPQSFISMAACVSVQVEDRLRTEGVQDPKAAPPFVKETSLYNVAHFQMSQISHNNAHDL